ncbi:MAG: hypothetical protein ABIX01_08275 [Chitinophagaceae bacterium]
MKTPDGGGMGVSTGRNTSEGGEKLFAQNSQSTNPVDSYVNE